MTAPMAACNAKLPAPGSIYAKNFKTVSLYHSVSIINLNS